VTQDIKYIVVLMLENRSFDHMLGFMKRARPELNGLTGNESNSTDLNDVNNPTKRVKVSPDANNINDVLSVDAGHKFADVNTQLFCNPGGPPAGPEQNGGFIYSYDQQREVTSPFARKIMKCFDPTAVPVLSRLANEFAVCDAWFSSVPGPTWPNRLFVHAATSNGYVDNSVHVYNSRTIFENLAASGRTWAVYYHDTAQSMWFNGLSTDEAKSHFSEFRNFERDAHNGSLPSYSFIEPQYFNFFTSKANDQHPPHSVVKGEQLIARVYNAVRQSPLWNNTMLVITYDEHGGTYDHVAPGKAIPPDSKTAHFAFDRYGVRVPAVVVSPFVPKAGIEHTTFDHTSIPATLKSVFSLPAFLTARDAAAATLSKIASLSSPRTDTPEELAMTEVMRMMEHEPLDLDAIVRDKAAGEMSLTPLSDLQQAIVNHVHELDVGEPSGLRALRRARRVDTEHDAAVYVREMTARFLAHRRSKRP